MSDDVAVANYVRRRIQEIKNQRNPLAPLAELRRGIKFSPGASPEIWSLTLSEIPESLESKNGEPTRGEWAIHLALCLFALHQRSIDITESCMHCESESESARRRYSLGSSVRKLVHKNDNEDNDESMTRRFNQLATSASLSEFAHHLRQIVALLNRDRVQMDYAALARDIFWFQFPDNRDKLRLQWGQDYYRSRQDIISE